MVETFKDIGLVIFRVATILPLLLFVTIYMGKRAIGELPIFDFLIIITLGSVVGADIADTEVSHLPTAIAIITIGVLQKFVAKWKVSNRKIGKLLSFEPTVVIQDGQLLDKNLKKQNYSIDNILQMLREKDIFDLNEVETAILEANGELSVLKKPEHTHVTLQDMNYKKGSTMTFPVIVEGEIYEKVLNRFELDEKWLLEKLKTLGVTDIGEVFYASINLRKEIHVSMKNDGSVIVPYIRH
ncbi:DUF421 domain-containing protein [Halalkalibacillus sediminis]|uniref:DUF421 domain-containing protein n=1 Tax=Halalkalibacillus sediminis TaxID=2018042 RepID=A0A2I0QV39_9BACI|nr:DUF421 domain-containing protein [Halalkalibacillus sediminis]PKR78211.1 DUF421 domain-containing protein [Halalkalibacillus sediminis]